MKLIDKSVLGCMVSLASSCAFAANNDRLASTGMMFTSAYDLSKDIAEQNDLTHKRPALAKSMKKELMKILNSANARFPKRK